MQAFLAFVYGAGALLKFVSGFAVFGFLVWSAYFTGSYELGILKGIGVFVAILFFSGILSMVPFGTTLAPIIFEWWWHRVPFWEFSDAAWAVTALSMLANVLVLFGILAEARNRR